MSNRIFSTSAKVILGISFTLPILPLNAADHVTREQYQLGRVCAISGEKIVVIKLEDGTIVRKKKLSGDKWIGIMRDEKDDNKFRLVTRSSPNYTLREGDAVLYFVIEGKTQKLLTGPAWLGILFEQYGFTLPELNREAWEKTRC